MIDLTVKTLDSQNHAFSLDDDQITVRGFKEYIAESVGVPADSQRLIYCGRVLQDEKKLNDYDVNGKVIHLVQRAPPQPGQRSNDSGQTQGQNQGPNQGQNHPQGWTHQQRTHFRLTRTQMYGNAMYLGAMSVPHEIVEGHGLLVPQLSNTLPISRLAIVTRMLDRVNDLIIHLQDPAAPMNPPSAENSQTATDQQVQEQELETDQESNNNGTSNSVPEASAMTAALSAIDENVLLLRSDFVSESDPQPVANDAVQQQPQVESRHQPQVGPPPQPQPQSQPQPSPLQEPQPEEAQSSTQSSAPPSAAEGQANRRSTLQVGWPPQVSDALQRLISTHDSLRPFLERYSTLMRTDPVLQPGPGPTGVEECQRIVDGVSECLHFMSHAYHALSDIIVDMGQRPPRNLRCRPTFIQHSVVLQPGSIPIQVEAHISVHGRNSNNNVANDEATETASGAATGAESAEHNMDSSNQPSDSESANQQTPGTHQHQPHHHQPHHHQAHTHSPFGAVFNLPSNVEVLMEVSPEGNMDAASGSEQSQTGETNNNNNHGARINGADLFPWASAPPPELIRNLMQAFGGHDVQGGISTTPITTRNPPSTGTGQQPHGTTIDNGSTSSGQSTQARSNVGTHPTTATQTRSTSRPHIFHQQAHPLGVGMAIGQDLDFDPFLPCNSRHIRRPSHTPGSTVTATSHGTRGSQTSTSETQAQPQSASASSTANTTGPATAAPPPAAQTNPTNLFMNFLQQILEDTMVQPEVDVTISSDSGNLTEALGSIINNRRGNTTQDATGADSSGVTPGPRRSTLADFLISRDIEIDGLATVNPTTASNFLGNLSVVAARNITLEELVRLRTGESQPLAQLRVPFQQSLQCSFQSCDPDVVRERTLNTLLTQLRSPLQSVERMLITQERDNFSRAGQRIDFCATIEALNRRHFSDILRNLFNAEIDDARFGQEMASSINSLARELCAVLRYSVRGGQETFNRMASRFVSNSLGHIDSDLQEFVIENFVNQCSIYYDLLPQPPDSEIIPLLVYKDCGPSQTTSAPSVPMAQPSTQESVPEPMDTEPIEERTSYEAAAADDGEEIPETFPDHDVLPPDWVPIIARDGVRQRRLLQTGDRPKQGRVTGRVTTYSDAYIGALPTKRRKIIEQQKSRLLVSPTPNHSAITTSMERLIRKGVRRAGIEEVDGATLAVASDPGVRRAFGQAIRDCLHPHRYETPDFPDPLRFPNATKYFAEQERPPK